MNMKRIAFLSEVSAMTTLTEMPNIGAVNAKKLEASGVENPDVLKTMGSKEAFLRVRMHSDPGACLSMLYGLEGAVQGIRWHELPQSTKDDLKAFYNAL